MASGNFNTQSFRISWVAAIILVQAWMAWIFIKYQVRRYRESTPGKKQPKVKKEKKAEPVANGSSPRAKAAKEKKQD